VKTVSATLGAVALALAVSGTASAADYVNSPPLRDVVNTSVSDCRAQSTLNVPMIAWGGDIPTLVANGNSLTTQSDSLFELVGINAELERQDVFSEQVEDYLSCKSPFLRGTQGMLNMAADITEADDRTKMVAIYQLSWSNGGDALVVKPGIGTVSDLKGKTIALQAYGPHVDYMATVLADAGLSMNDVNIKWVKELTAADSSPLNVFASDSSIDAAFMIIPDALALTSGGGIGTGAEGSVKGASIMLSTKSANRIISDVYVVRKDYFEANKDQVRNFVHGLMLAEESTREQLKAGGTAADAIYAAASEYLLGVAGDIEGAKGLWLDAETTGFRGNVKWVSSGEPRSWLSVNNDAQPLLKALGLMSKPYTLAHAGWDYEVFKDGLNDTAGVEKPKFNQAELAKVVDKLDKTGQLGDNSLFEFPIYFEPNQQTFEALNYQEEFRKVIGLALRYGGAVITVEGHSDPLGYLQKKKDGASNIVLARAAQAAKNLSMGRAIAVQQALISYADAGGITMDASQFATLGKGITDPATGKDCGGPCAPKTEAEWRSNMRVVFRIVNVEAEASVFTPLN
jgi:ABC-type nitrate/sulfonate/bicarbonate transport system substrate-binding protein